MNLDEIERRRLVVFAHGTDWPTAMARLFEDDVPALLAEVRRLREPLALYTELEALEAKVEWFGAERDGLREEVRRLEGEVEKQQRIADLLRIELRAVLDAVSVFGPPELLQHVQHVTSMLTKQSA